MEDLGGETVPAPIEELKCGALGTDQNLAPYIKKAGKSKRDPAVRGRDKAFSAGTTSQGSSTSLN